MDLNIDIVKKILIKVKEENSATVNDIWFDDCVEVIRFREIHEEMLSVDLFHPERRIMCNFYFGKYRINEVIQSEREIKLNKIGL
jgi:hypothetical protein